jgi:hypothetical protein
MTRSPRRPAFRPQGESLEGRSLMALLVVTNVLPFGRGSLNHAINQANATRGADTIVFQIPTEPGEPAIIDEPRGGFAPITGQVTINGFTQPGSSANTSTNPLVNNTKWGVLLLGLSQRPIFTVEPGGSGTQLRGLIFAARLAAPNNNATGVLINRANLVKIDGDGFVAAETGGLPSAVTIYGGSYNTVGGDVAGTPALQNVMNSYTFGVTTTAGSQHNAIFGNILGGQTSLSGQLRTGIYFQPGANNNSIVGNFLIGNDVPIVNGGIGNFFDGNVVIPK